MPYRLNALYHPAWFQSAARTGGWFEGWYFKLVDPVGRHPIAVIPGVARDEDGATSHSFVQVLRPGHPVEYHRFPFDAFTWSTDRFAIAVGLNTFSEDGLHLELPGVSGDIRFGPWSAWPVTALAPGIMGWYRYVPRMECYHAVLSMDHVLHGSLRAGDLDLGFEDGRGYTEKDWGTSFPSSWVWVQANRFLDAGGVQLDGVSLTASVARIPWLGGAFTGHIAGLLLDGTLHRFATYTGSKLLSLELHPDGAHVVMGDSRKRLSITVRGTTTGALKAPVRGEMSGRADESLDATVDVALELRDSGWRAVFSGTGHSAGAEVMDDRGELFAR